MSSVFILTLLKKVLKKMYSFEKFAISSINTQKKLKYVSHGEKSPQVVARRNARERKRVQTVNNAFIKLRNVLPIENSRGKRISKAKTLICAIDYIKTLISLLKDYDLNWNSSEYLMDNNSYQQQNNYYNY